MTIKYNRTLAQAYGLLELITTFMVRYQDVSTLEERAALATLVKDFCGTDRAREAAISQFITQLEHIVTEEDDGR